jgi:hypothetical protein
MASNHIPSSSTSTTWSALKVRGVKGEFVVGRLRSAWYRLAAAVTKTKGEGQGKTLKAEGRVKGKG